ncbi:hypothetical protein [Streptomyces qinzhouensis]|uniref:Uncharacterized protein n=1 Tax=Streptomyces qinzhouensis TaxID=2599401 RepID=A0A5B8JFQ0_9ACTN|nr:hypothetical protein [Streptomyces qinzhouensis]QDY76530.1 hypothetical protein FQU76_08280 [Streptomyces qinzhouensis]
MTACAVETAATRWNSPGGGSGSGGGAPGEDGGPGEGRPAGGAGVLAPGAAAMTLSADGAYAARLAGAGDALYPERWTLDGPEPYAVPLPLYQPEERDTAVLPLADGRVLIHRRAAGRQLFSLLYPSGPETGELPLGGIGTPTASGYEAAVLLPPSPDGSRAYLLVPGSGPGADPRPGPAHVPEGGPEGGRAHVPEGGPAHGPEGGPAGAGAVTAIWRVTGGSAGPERVAEIPGRCTGGVWLDRTGRLLALDRQREPGGPVKAVAVDLERGGEVSPLLQIAPDSNDRLLLAAPDSGLLVVRSDAPGDDRIGWGVLGGERPVRFPECLRVPGGSLVPFAVQPGQILQPESCAVAFAVGTGTGLAPAVWRPAGRELRALAAPDGWFPGTGRWTPEGVLHLPYATPATPCGVARLTPPEEPPGGSGCPAAAPSRPAGSGPRPSGALRPVPLQQAPLVDRTQAG